MAQPKTLFDDVSSKDGEDQNRDSNDNEYKHVRYIGEIPKCWQVSRVGDLLSSLDAGYSASGEDRPARNGEKGVLKVSAVSYEVFQPFENKRVPPSNQDDLKTSPRKGDLVISRSNTPELVGSCVYVPDDFPNLYLPDTLWRIRVKEDAPIRPRYLAYVLSTDTIRARIRAIATGTSRSMKKIAMRTFRRLKVPIPSLEEQRRIARILATCDRAIQQVDALIEQKRERLRGLRQRLLTGEERFPGCVESEEMKEVDIGEIPVDWSQRQLGDLFTWKTVKNEDNEIDKVITVGKDEICDQKDHFNRSVASDDLSNYRIIEPGDFVYDPMSAYYGALGRYDLDEPGVVSPAYRVLRLNDGYHSDFVKFLLQSHYVLFRIDASSQQNNKSGKRRGLRQDAFASIQVHIPPVEEQCQIAGVLNTAEAEIEKLEQKRDALQRQKKGLMQRLLTGAVRTV